MIGLPARAGVTSAAASYIRPGAAATMVCVRTRPTVSLTPRTIAVSVVAIAVADSLLWQTDLPLLGDGVLDELAHVSLAVLVVAAARTVVSSRFFAGLVIGAVLIDVDHVPRQLGWHGLEPGTSRPYPHCLLTLALVALAALLARGRLRAALAGAAVGLAAHFFRDLAEPGQGGAGVMLLWPFSSHAFVLPYVVLAALVAALAVAALARRHPRFPGSFH